MSKVLLHTCCGPCTAYTNKWLVENNFKVTGYFYNPNIFPAEEYERRKLAMGQYAAAVGFEAVYEANDLRTEPGSCKNCYQVRLEKTARFAKESGSDYFSTTLLISPYQKHELLKQMGEEIGKKAGIEFFYHDFRTGFREGQQMAREMKLYRQKYCGCAKEAKHAQAD
ncbi:MAG: epoxyqueuosine reductase QueH [Candidatus Margulisiibacteriota bacterium]|nr:epoxyqueuosine reductase QueH [Candidatus Margulisiibacteriota bacterium]